MLCETTIIFNYNPIPKEVNYKLNDSMYILKGKLQVQKDTCVIMLKAVAGKIINDE